MTPARAGLLAAALATAGACIAGEASTAIAIPDQSVATLKATGGLPAHFVTQFTEPVGFAQAASGEYVVLDRRQHTVYAIDAKKASLRKVIQIGFETGKVLQPAALAISRDDIFAVADGPGGNERIQYFTLTGAFLGGFYLRSRVAPRVVSGPLVLNGAGSMAFTGKTFLVSQPGSDALFSEFDTTGAVIRHVGVPRPTGQERTDREAHIALNVGLPLVDPAGGFYFVFQTGRPMFRKYSADGRLIFERHIEGIEIDARVLATPTSWPRSVDGALPVVPPIVRTAGVDAQGRLWVALVEPYTYVYDRDGTKTRTVQFEAAGVIAQTSLSFAAGDRVLVTPGCYEFPAR